MGDKETSAYKDRKSNEEIQEKNRQTQERINTQNVTSQEGINEKNLEFQRENLEYQKALQQQIFQREDTSYQRTVNDMRAAGLSPLTMNGTNGSGEAIAVGALNAGNAPQVQGYMEQGLYNHQQERMQKMAELRNILEGFNDITNSIAQIQKTREETHSLKLQNDYQQQTLLSRINEQRINEAMKNYSKLSSAQRARYDNFYGITEGMNREERLARIIYTELGLGRKNTSNNPFQDTLGKYSVDDFNDSYTTYYDVADPTFRGIKEYIEKYLSNNTKKPKDSNEELEELKSILKGYGKLLNGR